MAAGSTRNPPGDTAVDDSRAEREIAAATHLEIHQRELRASNSAN